MFVLLSLLLYQVMVYHNHLTGRPLRALKHMLGNSGIIVEQLCPSLI